MKSKAITLLATFALTGFTGTIVRAQDIFVSNQGVPGSVSEFDPSGNLVTTFNTGLDDPTGLAFDSSGNLYVANQFGTVAKFDSSGNLINASFVTPGEAFDVTFDKSGDLYVSNYTSNNGGTVTEYDSNGNLINVSFASGLVGTSGLAFDSSGNLFVVNSNRFKTS